MIHRGVLAVKIVFRLFFCVYLSGEPRPTKSKGEGKSRKRAAKAEALEKKQQQQQQQQQQQNFDDEGSIGDRLCSSDEGGPVEEKKVVRDQERRFANNARERYANNARERYFHALIL